MRSGAVQLPVALRALRHRNFRLFFGGQLLSLTGTWMQNVAQSWLVYRLTGSSLLLGSVGFASQIPILLLAPVGGAVADRCRRHRVIVAAQSAAMLLAFLLAALTLSGQVRVWHVTVLASMLGCVNAFDVPARQSFFVEMVGKDDLLNAIALNSTIFNSARVMGPAVAGILVAAVGEGWCFLLNGVSFLAVIAGLLAMRLPPPAAPPARAPVLTELVEGIRFARGAMPVRVLLMLLGIVSLVGVPYTVLMPVFADQILHGGARGLGLLMGATGLGAVTGALAVASRTSVRGLGRVVGWASAGFGASLVLFSLSRWFWVSWLLLIPVGFCLMVQMACSNTLIQAMVPDHLRGRVMALYSIMFMGMAPFGALGAGVAAERLGAPWTVALGGAACVAASLVYRSRLPALRQEARQLIIAQGMAGGEPPAPGVPRS
ncbi:MAG: MFS transporter [Bryobacteraceae bacterium]